MRVCLILLAGLSVASAFAGLTSSRLVSGTELNSLFSSSANDALQQNNRHSSSDWLYNVQSLPQSQVLREVRGPVLASAGWALVVSLVQRVVPVSLSIPATAHGFLVSALGLLLVFRTNSAYQRFYEGRKIWEHILSVSRNLSRMVQLYSKDVGTGRKRRVLNLIAAYPYLLRHHIRRGCLCDDRGEGIEERFRLKLCDRGQRAVETRHEGDKSLNTPLPPQTCYVDRRDIPWSLIEKPELVTDSQNRPLWVCDRLGQELVNIPYGPNFTSRERLAMLGAVDKLTNAIGQCERIHQTAVPLNYARHSLRSLTLWLFTLPFALVKDMGILTAPVTALVAWLLFGVYQIGYSIEDPFQGSLRLSNLCDAIRHDVLGSNFDSVSNDDVMALDWSAKALSNATEAWNNTPILLEDATSARILVETQLKN